MGMKEEQLERLQTLQPDEQLERKKRIRKRIIIAVVSVLLLAAVIVASLLIGKRLLALVSDASRVRAFVDQHAVLSRVLFVLLTVVQIVLAVIPGEPFELAAGYAFGTIQGTILCLIGALIGGSIDFWLVRKFGMKVVRVFFSQEKIDQLKFLKASKQRDLWMFVLMFIPGTPKDIFSYVAGLTDISWAKWMVISCVARIPSIITSTLSADALGSNKLLQAVIIYGITLILSGIGVLTYNYICKKKEMN